MKNEMIVFFQVGPPPQPGHSHKKTCGLVQNFHVHVHRVGVEILLDEFPPSPADYTPFPGLFYDFYG